MTEINKQIARASGPQDVTLKPEDVAQGGVTVEGGHVTEAMGGAKVKTEGDVTSSIRAVGVSVTATAPASFDDVMSAKPAGARGASADAGFKVTAAAAARVKVQAQARAAAEATGRAVETANHGKAEQKS